MNSGGDRLVLFVVTSHGQLGDSGKPTGYYLPEVSHPHRALVNRGFVVEFASPRGGKPPMDPGSARSADDVSRKFLATEAWSEALHNSLRVDQIDPDRYRAVFFAGGHGTMWDFPDDPAVCALARSIYRRGGVVAAVCHGPSALVNVRIGEESLVAGKTVTCFTNEEETAVALADVVPEDRLRERGATIIPAAPFQPQVVTSERLVTGQNPASAEGVGLAIAKLLDSGPD
jgi:putative intracellular protease/amidase